MWLRPARAITPLSKAAPVAPRTCPTTAVAKRKQSHRMQFQLDGQQKLQQLHTPQDTMTPASGGLTTRPHLTMKPVHVATQIIAWALQNKNATMSPMDPWAHELHGPHGLQGLKRPMGLWTHGAGGAHGLMGPVDPVGPWVPWAHGPMDPMGPQAPWAPSAKWTHGLIGPMGFWAQWAAWVP